MEDTALQDLTVHKEANQAQPWIVTLDFTALIILWQLQLQNAALDIIALVKLKQLHLRMELVEIFALQVDIVRKVAHHQELAQKKLILAILEHYLLQNALTVFQDFIVKE